LAPHVLHLNRRINETVEDIFQKRPKVLLTIDSKAFTMRVAKRVQKRQRASKNKIKIIHMVAPTVWAWRPGRAKQISKFLDHLLVLFPFEPPYFRKHGLNTTFIGHPISRQATGDGTGYRKRLGIKNGTKIISVLPGSRPGEVTKLLPVFAKTVKLLQRQYSDLHIVIPTVDSVKNIVERQTSSWDVSLSITTDLVSKLDAFAASNSCLAASGTVTLELAIAQVPTVVAYRVNPVSAIFGYILVDMDAIVLPNRLLEKQLFPLFAQWECKPEKLFREICRQLENPQSKNEMIRISSEIRKKLCAPEGVAELVAADVVLKTIEFSS